MRFAFVILHYMVAKETTECIESILHNLTIKQEDEVYIIIVDNGSKNDSYLELGNKYKNINYIYFLHSKENLGFAKGNNIGFMYAKNNIQADFIILLNNDTILKQSDFLQVVDELYNEYQFAVLGPDIVTMNGIHQNPYYSKKWNAANIKKYRFKLRIKYALSYLGIDKFFIKDEDYRIKDRYIEQDVLDATLHGACLIFSKKYIDMFDGLCDKTFLYMEEDILKLIIDYSSQISLYSPRLVVFHKEDVSTNALTQSKRDSKLKKYCYIIQSTYVYEQIYREMQRMGKGNESIYIKD